MRKEDVLFHLIGTGLLPLQSIVADDLRVASGSRRHEHFMVRRARGRGFFVKAVREGTFAAVETMSREAGCYMYVQSRPELAALVATLPELLHYDARKNVLVLELLEGETLTEHHARNGGTPAPTARLAGETLARCHRDTEAIVGGNGAAFRTHAPWILGTTYPPALMPLLSASPGVLATIAQYPAHRQTLARLLEEWSPATLVHGDLKFDNCLVSEGRLRIVDWELVDIGDPLWDVASLLQGHLAATIPPAGDARTLDAATVSFAARLATARSAMQALWNGYREAAGPGDDDLDRCTGYIGARAMHAAFEHAFAFGTFTYEALAQLHMGLAILSAPQAVRSELFDA